MAKQCPCSGSTLDKLVHPAVLIVLSRESVHGYEIASLLAQMPMFRGRRPDTTGVYRCLGQMEKQGYVASAWVKSENGPGKRVFSVTAKGRGCLARWVQTLGEYRQTIGLLLEDARQTVAASRRGKRARATRSARPG